LHALDLAAGDRERPANATENPRRKPVVCGLKACTRAAPSSNGNGAEYADGEASPLSVNSHWRRSGHKLVSLPTTPSRPNIFETSHFKFKTFALQGGSRATFDYAARAQKSNVSLDLRLNCALVPDPPLPVTLVVLDRIEQREREKPDHHATRLTATSMGRAV
jgi:hypothetical protein